MDLNARIEQLEKSNLKILKEKDELAEKVALLEQTMHQEIKRITDQVLAAFESVNKIIATQEVTQKDLLNLIKQENSKPKLKTQASYDSEEKEPEPQQSPLQKAFGNKLPAELFAKNLTKQQLMRLSVIYEFIDTEIDYVRDLNVILSVIQPQLKASGLLVDDEKMFSNLNEVLEANQKFAAAITARREQNAEIEEVGDIITNYADTFKVYTVYCGNYPQALRLVRQMQNNPSNREILAKLASVQECRGLNLESFLIKPVQRICKYPLLLRELIKYTDPQQKDYSFLTIAMEKIEKIVLLVNESTKSLGEHDRLVGLLGKIDLLPSISLDDKRLLKDGIISRTANGKTKERYFVLMNDCLLVCKPVHKFKSEFEIKISTTDLGLSSRASLNQDKLEQWSLTFTTEEEKQKWSDAFIEALKLVPNESRKDFEKLQRTASTNKTGMNVLTSQLSKSSLVLGKKLASSTNIINESTTPVNEPEVHYIEEPDYYECNENKYRKAYSATGQAYFYNLKTKESTWTLTKPVPIYSKQLVITSQDGDIVVTPCSTNIQWRQVTRDGISYFYNIYTLETKLSLDQ